MARLKRYGYHKKSGRKALPENKALTKNIRFRPTTFDLFYQLRDMIDKDEENGIKLLEFLLQYDGKIPELIHKIATTQFVYQRSEELVMAIKLLSDNVTTTQRLARRAVREHRQQSVALFCTNNCPHFDQTRRTINNLQAKIGSL